MLRKGVHINKISPTNKNNLLVKVGNETEAQSLIKTVKDNDDLNALFSADIPRLITKRVILTRVPSLFTEDQLLKALSLEMSYEIKILSIKKLSKLHSPFFTYLLFFPDAYVHPLIGKGKLLIDFHTILIQKYIRDIRCFCYGHLNSASTYPTVCSKCSEFHSHTECNSDTICCINCKSLKDSSVNSDHTADSAKCSIFQRLLRQEDSFFDFYERGLKPN